MQAIHMQIARYYLNDGRLYWQPHHVTWVGAVALTAIRIRMGTVCPVWWCYESNPYAKV